PSRCVDGRRVDAGRAASGGFPVFVIGAFAVVEDGVLGGEVGGIRGQPGFQVFRLDRHDAAVVAGGGDFGRRGVGDGGEGVQLAAVGLDAAGPQAGGDHVAAVAGAELQHLVAAAAVDVFVEGAGHHHAVAV